MARYILDLKNGRGELEELETWSQRTSHTYRWEHNQVGTQWETRLVVNERRIGHVVGVGRTLKAAKVDAAIKINNADPPILTK
ncbi:hypothetical protein FRC08_004093 [Ceratobasidium sp. 394]|nr:hypothetical protein FRC08_004093 [Ceratobasidium sp. 394]KAG9087267.1 hypothetical protein FS749_003034 [Ceratobasidium sp. UAMH 11750]